jgi:hypothetical protein
MGVASKIPIRGGETGGERSLRSDHQRRSGVTRRRGAGKYLRQGLFQDIHQNPGLECSAGILRSASKSPLHVGGKAPPTGFEPVLLP